MSSSPLLGLFFSLVLSVVSFCNYVRKKGWRIVKEREMEMEKGQR